MTSAPPPASCSLIGQLQLSPDVTHTVEHKTEPYKILVKLNKAENKSAVLNITSDKVF